MESQSQLDMMMKETTEKPTYDSGNTIKGSDTR